MPTYRISDEFARVIFEVNAALIRAARKEFAKEAANFLPTTAFSLTDSDGKRTNENVNFVSLSQTRASCGVPRNSSGVIAPNQRVRQECLYQTIQALNALQAAAFAGRAIEERELSEAERRERKARAALADIAQLGASNPETMGAVFASMTAEQRAALLAALGAK